MRELVNYLKNYADFDDDELEIVINAFTKRVFTKNELIFTAGKISNEMYFVTKGCVRLFYNVDGVDKTAFFYTEGQFICAGESYTYNVLAKENYQAIERSEIYILPKTKIDKLLAISSKFELLARVATENELITCQKIIQSFVTKSPEERYIELLNTQRDLFQRLPQQYIASFLGVSPETLSRIKTRVFKKKNS